MLKDSDILYFSEFDFTLNFTLAFLYSHVTNKHFSFQIEDQRSGILKTVS